MKVLSAEQMREVDRLTSERYGIPSLQLMENAASRTVEAVERRFGSATRKRILVISGRGNNGGDGAAVSRLLAVKGAKVDLLTIGRIEGTKGDARTNFERAAGLGGNPNVVEMLNADDLQPFLSRQYDLLFDAMLGTGLTRPAGGLIKAAIDLLNDQRGTTPLIAIDIPTGLASDSSELIGPTVRAHLTVTFTAPKPGNVLPPACDYNGELIVAPIGAPDELIDSSGSKLNLVERAMVEAWLAASRRTPHANKGDAGKVLIVAGSRGKTGAACLAGEAAMRAGAGLVTVAAPRSSQPVIASRIISECMTEPLAETEAGTADSEAADLVRELAAGRDVVALGPGLGLHDSTKKLVRRLVDLRTGPLVIDADGLNSLAPWDQDLRGDMTRPLILTPHPGEMARLTGQPVPEVLRNRVEVARRFAATHSLTVVLKSSRTLVAAPDDQVWINPTGNAGMATGGSGDVLTGFIAGLLGQKLDDPVRAAIAAVYIHGLAGDIAAARLGTRAMIASDITSSLGEAFMEIGGEPERFTRQL
jgi:NAD(P)H-hydrate epimerase